MALPTVILNGAVEDEDSSPTNTVSNWFCKGAVMKSDIYFEVIF
jgi:hypothetical protein